MVEERLWGMNVGAAHWPHTFNRSTHRSLSGDSTSDPLRSTGAPFFFYLSLCLIARPVLAELTDLRLTWPPKNSNSTDTTKSRRAVNVIHRTLAQKIQ